MYYSHKFNKAAISYKLAVPVHSNKIIAINGPFTAATHNAVIYKSILMGKLSEHKQAIGNTGYNGCPKVSTKHNYDIKELKKFKTRARQRHEALNSCIKAFQCLNVPFQHKQGLQQHQACFEAVCVIVQYYWIMDCAFLMFRIAIVNIYLDITSPIFLLSIFIDGICC